MRRVAPQFVVAFGILLAAAILDVGPRATAAYLSMADVSSGAGMGASADQGDGRPSKRLLGQPQDGLPHTATHLQGGGMSAPSSGPSSGSTPVFAALTAAEPPSCGLVVYFREPAASIQLSAFIDSILDPPRQA